MPSACLEKKTTADRVAHVLDAVMDIDGVDEVMTQSIDGGLSLVTVKFFVGQNMEDSKIKLQRKLAGEMDKKPLQAMDPQIKRSIRMTFR